MAQIHGDVVSLSGVTNPTKIHGDVVSLSGVTNPTKIHGDVVSLSGVRIWRCREWWRRSQTRLRSCVVVAVVQAGNCSSDGPLAWECPYATGMALKRQKKKKKGIFKLWSKLLPLLSEQFSTS